jgi:P-aminobenzoate N-oxygenase AurF
MTRTVDRATREPSAETSDAADEPTARDNAASDRAASDRVVSDSDASYGAASYGAASDRAASGISADQPAASERAASDRAAAASPAASPLVADEERRAPREAYAALIARLSRQSVTKRYEAFRDVDWDAPEYAVRDDDPRWELGADDPLGGTAWYRAKPAAERARIGLYRVATFMKVGVQFENVLSRGLLLFILTRPEQSPEHRYAYHELIEESHHSMMFSEFVRRSGFDIGGLTPRLAWLGTRVAGLAASFPELFFVFVLGGEDPIDHAQRLALSGTREMHPLLRRISQIHITEEARHLCFARSFLREYVPQLHPLKRMALAATAPLILRITAELMLRPPPALIREFAVPPAVVAEAFTNNRAYREVTLASLAKVHALMHELGLVTPRTAPLWRTLGAA